MKYRDWQMPLVHCSQKKVYICGQNILLTLKGVHKRNIACHHLSHNTFYTRTPSLMSPLHLSPPLIHPTRYLKQSLFFKITVISISCLSVSIFVFFLYFLLILLLLFLCCSFVCVCVCFSSCVHFLSAFCLASSSLCISSSVVCMYFTPLIKEKEETLVFFTPLVFF